VLKAGEGKVLFPGAIYDSAVVRALRFHAAAYCHGHSVGGTNPSLVEALGAGNAIVGHDNPYNRWVAGPEQWYFPDKDGCARCFDEIEAGGERLRQARAAARHRFETAFLWSDILSEYEALCLAATEPAR
jgi:glycosyltransferase involved in cell wall biosynthesis